MFILTESGRVFDDSRPYPEWLVELVGGEWVKPVSKVLVTELMDGRELSAEEVSKLVESGNL